MHDADFNPLSMFPYFYAHPYINDLARYPQWSISTPDTKMPIDMTLATTAGIVAGARKNQDEGTYHEFTLDQLVTALPTAANHAFFLNVDTQGYGVIDIEPDCPADIAEHFISLAISEKCYVERSMSGRGWHILFPVRPDMLNDSVIGPRAVMRHPRGWYEVLLQHWVTFTRDPGTPPTTTARTSDAPEMNARTIDEIVYTLRDQIPESPTPAHAVADIDDVDFSILTDNDNFIVNAIINNIDDIHDKEPDYFHHDMSRWEFSRINTVIAKVNADVELFLAYPEYAGEKYTITEDRFVAMVYKIIIETIPERDKHHTNRNGLPFLLHRVLTALSYYNHLCYQT